MCYASSLDNITEALARARPFPGQARLDKRG
jgi:hypothetical protein